MSNARQWVAVLGRQDRPTDAIEDYCRRLAGALGAKGCTLQILRVAWEENGWRDALEAAQRQVAEHKPEWALLQYTALGWSKRGFPFGLLRTLRRVQQSGARAAIVFHDPFPFPGERLQDRARQKAQGLVMTRAARSAEKIISTVPVECVPWMNAAEYREKAAFIPVGANVSSPSRVAYDTHSDLPTVVLFGVTGGNTAEAHEIGRVALAVQRELGALRVIALGRGAREAEAELRKAVNGSGVHLEVCDVLPPEQVGNLLAQAHAQLFVRGGVSTRRSSAIAGICCGLPLVGYAGPETAPPITEAGVRLVPVGDVDGLARELVFVLRDDVLRKELQERSRRAAGRYFSWEAIAGQYLAALGEA